MVDPSYLGEAEPPAAGVTGAGTPGETGAAEGSDGASGGATGGLSGDGTTAGEGSDVDTGEDAPTSSGGPAVDDGGSSTGIVPGCGNGMVGPGEFCFIGGPTLLEEDVHDLAVGHFDGDLRLDVAAGRSESVSVLFGTGDGSFPLISTAANLDADCRGVAAIDLDGDSADDLAVARAGDGDAVRWYVNDGGGIFADPSTSALPDPPRALVAAQLDRAAPTHVVASYGGGDGGFSYFSSLGDGTVGGAVESSAGSEPVAIAAAPLDANASVDVAFALRSGKAVAVAMNNGDGTFSAAVEYPVGFRCAAVVAADLDAQGGLDLAAAVEEGGDEIVIMLNDGTGTFSVQPTAISVGDQPSDVVAADMDSDGDLDLLVVTSGDHALWFIEGVGDGSFAPAVAVSVAPELNAPVSLVAADFNEDTVPDLAIGGEHGVAFVLSDP